MSEARQDGENLAPDKGLLRCIIDSGSDLIYVKDVNSVYRGCNKMAEKFIGLKESEQIGKTDFDFFDREIAEEIQKKDREILASGQEHCLEEWVTFPDGRDVLLESKKAPFYGPDGEVAGLVGISRDITARKREEKEKEQLILDLQQALQDVRLLSGLLPTCPYCKKIRLKDQDERNPDSWVPIETYISKRSTARFSHGICPDCMKEHYPGAARSEADLPPK